MILNYIFFYQISTFLFSSSFYRIRQLVATSQLSFAATAILIRLMHTCCIFLRRLGPSQLQRPPHAITRSMDAIGRVSFLTRSLSSNQDLDNSVIITKSCSQVSLECCIPSYVTHNISHRPLSSLMSLITFISSRLNGTRHPSGFKPCV